MPVDVVVDGPRGRRVRAVWRRTPTVVGALLVCSAAVAALPLIALTIAVGVYLVVWIDFRAHPEKVWPDWFEGVRGMLAPMWLVALSVTTVGVLLGLRLLRENRNLILFLRRFGYRPATQTVTEATSRLGDFWRVVTLDDENIEALGPGDGVEGFVEVVGTVKRSYRSVAPVVVKGWKLVMRAAAAGLALALVLVVSPGPDWTARGERAGASHRPGSETRQRRSTQRPHRRSGPRRRGGDGHGVVRLCRRRVAAVDPSTTRLWRRLPRRHGRSRLRRAAHRGATPHRGRATDRRGAEAQGVRPSAHRADGQLSGVARDRARNGRHLRGTADRYLGAHGERAVGDRGAGRSFRGPVCVHRCVRPTSSAHRSRARPSHAAAFHIPRRSAGPRIYARCSGHEAFRPCTRVDARTAHSPASSDQRSLLSCTLDGRGEPRRGSKVPSLVPYRVTGLRADAWLAGSY